MCDVVERVRTGPALSTSVAEADASASPSARAGAPRARVGSFAARSWRRQRPFQRRRRPLAARNAREAGSRRARVAAIRRRRGHRRSPPPKNSRAKRPPRRGNGERRAASGLLALGRFGGGWYDGGAVVGLAFPVDFWFPFCFCFCFSADAASAGAVVIRRKRRGRRAVPLRTSPRKSVRPRRRAPCTASAAGDPPGTSVRRVWVSRFVSRGGGVDAFERARDPPGTTVPPRSSSPSSERDDSIAAFANARASSVSETVSVSEIPLPPDIRGLAERLFAFFAFRASPVAPRAALPRRTARRSPREASSAPPPPRQTAPPGTKRTAPARRSTRARRPGLRPGTSSYFSTPRAGRNTCPRWRPARLQSKRWLSVIVLSMIVRVVSCVFEYDSTTFATAAPAAAYATAGFVSRAVPR